ncbi:response regulator [Candidatus Uhrbacteria bacterium]|nr:response regulator [Candidatus Uhrbacteria bacterium]
MPIKKKNQQKRILIVEDEKPIAQTLGLKLFHQGYEIVHAYDGDEALALLEKHSFDLLLLDIIMPNTDGFEVLRSLKKSTPVFVLTNLCQEEDAAICKKLGAQRFFVKSETSLSDVVHHINAFFA